MKAPQCIAIFALMLFTSCGTSIKVLSDYDTKATFSNYKTFAFYKPGIDKADISDLDKKRIMRAIESELTAKGFTKSNSPDVVISFFTKSRERININNNQLGYGYGFGYWNPWWFGGINNTNVNQYTEGTLFIDLIDKSTNDLVWQGIGSAPLRKLSAEKKEAHIKLLVKEILGAYPPGQQK